jgi:hypothetical protein
VNELLLLCEQLNLSILRGRIFLYTSHVIELPAGWSPLREFHDTEPACQACVWAEGVAQGWCSADRSGNGACVAGDVTGSTDSSSACFNTSDYWAWFDAQCPGVAVSQGACIAHIIP